MEFTSTLGIANSHPRRELMPRTPSPYAPWPLPGPGRPRHSVHDEKTVRAPRPTDPGQPPPAARERSGVVPRPSDFEHFARIDKHGRVLTGHGQVEELAALAAYACRIGDLIGEALQFGPTIAIEATFSDGSLFVYRDTGGEVVGIKPQPGMALRHLRARLHL